MSKDFGETFNKWRKMLREAEVSAKEGKLDISCSKLYDLIGQVDYFIDEHVPDTEESSND